MGRIVRSLNRLGIDRMRGYLARIRAGAAAEPPGELFEDPAYSTELPVEIVVEPRAFSDRLRLGRYLSERLAPLGPDVTDRDVGLWSWLSLYYFDQVCPRAEDGTRRPGQDYRHIADLTYRYRYRHLLLGPYLVYRRHGVRSTLLLSGAVHVENALYHEIVSRRDLIANRGVIEAALLLYYDTKRGRPKSGAQGGRQPGGVRRFVRVLQQLDVTYDIYGLSGMQILELLPAEFDPWRPPRQAEMDMPGGPHDEAADEPLAALPAAP